MRDAGSLLVRAGLIDSDALAQARTDRAKGGGTLAEHLVLAGVVEDDQLTQFFRERLMVPRVGGERLRSVPSRIISRIPAELAGELRVVPVALDAESSLTVAMSDPSDTHALDELEFFTEHYVVRAVASQRQIAWCLDHYYGVATPLLAETDSDPAFVDEAFVDAKTKPFIEATTAPFIDAKTEPFGRSHPRPKRVSEAIRSARHRVVPPATAPPPVRREGETAQEATLEDLEASEGLATGEEAKPDFIDQLEELEESSYELVLDDEDDDYSEHPAIELDAEEPDFGGRTETLADGSPSELAPRAGEVLVNRESDQVVGGPAVVLDDSLFMLPASGEPVRFELVEDDDDEATGEVRPPLHEPVSVDEEPTGVVIQLEADEPEISDGVVTEAIERGTDSAPILLSEIKQAVAEAEKAAEATSETIDEELDDRDERGEEAESGSPELVIQPADEEVDEAAVVLLEMPKRKRRSTSRGVGDFSARAAQAFKLRTASDTIENLVPAPVITDDQDKSEILPELEAEEIAGEATVDDDWELDEPSSSLSSAEATVVAEIEGNWGSPEEDVDRDRVLDTVEQLAGAVHRDEIVAAVLDYLDQYCDRVVFLALKSGALEPFQIRSSQPLETPKSVRLPLREVSLLRDIVDTRLPYRGPLEDEPSQKLLTSVFGDIRSDGLAVPVAVRGRVVGLLYGDGISPALSGDSVGLVTQAAGRALERILKRAGRSDQG